MTENMYIYVLRPARLGMLTDGPTEAEESSIKRHSAYLESLAEKGAVLMAGHTDMQGEQTFGIVVFYAEDDAAAEAFMQADPVVAEGVLNGQVQPFSIAFHSTRLKLESD